MCSVTSLSHSTPFTSLNMESKCFSYYSFSFLFSQCFKNVIKLATGLERRWRDFINVGREQMSLGKKCGEVKNVVHVENQKPYYVKNDSQEWMCVKNLKPKLLKKFFRMKKSVPQEKHFFERMRERRRKDWRISQKIDFT